MSLFTFVNLLVVLAVLTMVQVPLDLRTHRLSRRATCWATIAIAVIVVIDSWRNRAFVSAAASVLATLAVVGVYGIVYSVSPRSLGWGDLMLVAPLTLAVAYVAVELVLWWQLLAATTGALHGVWVRARSEHNYIPFGPHLLVGAWLMLLLSV